MEPPRLAYLLKKFPRLSETFILNEILAQEAGGRRLHVFARRERDPEPLHAQFSRLQATVETLPSRREINPWGTLFGGEGNDQELFEDLGRLVQESKAWGHPRFPSLLGEALYLLRRTRELGIRHVHTHFATDSAFVAMLLSRLGGPSYSLTAHAKDIYRSTVDPRLLGHILEQSVFTVTVCDANVRHLSERLPATAIARLRRLYNGIDLTEFQLRCEGRDPDHVLSVGRLVEKKGYFVLLDAVRTLLDRGGFCRVTIAGDGEERERLEARREELGLTDHVRMLGAVDQGTVRKLMGEATVLCLPCVIGEDGNRDALPTVLLEALACGLPVISTPVTGIPEIVAEGRAGILVPERDIEATADALQGLLGDSDRRAALARAGRAHVEREFDSQRISATLTRWLDEALERAEERCASRA